MLAVPLSWLQLLKELFAHTTQGVAYCKETMTLCSLNWHDNIWEDLNDRGWAIGDMLLPALREQLEKVKRMYEKWVARQLSPAEARFAKLIAAAAAEAVAGTQGNPYEHMSEEEYQAYGCMRQAYEQVMEFGVKVPYAALPKIFE